MIKYDCHVHSAFSSDSDTPCEDQIKKAIELGMRGICFTDHMDYDFPCTKESGMNFEFDPEAYFEELYELKNRYSDRIEVLAGIELGLRNESGIMDDIRRRYEILVNKYDFDLVIGSTHCLEYTDPYYRSPYWDNRSAKEGLETYFNAILENIRDNDEFDTLGHLDYLVRYIPCDETGSGPQIYDPADYSDIIDMILKELIDNGKALEINTAGLKYGLGFFHPRREILKRYRELNGELITIGSDGHRPEHICYDFPEVCRMLRDDGFGYYAVFKKRKPVLFRLDD